MISLNYIFLIIFIMIAFYLDTRTKKIPNKLTASGIIVGLLYNGFIYGIVGIKSSFVGIILGFLVFFLIYLIGGVGGGDVKLFAAIGSITTPYFVIYTTIYSFIIAGFIGLIILLFRKDKKVKTFPLMYAVLPSVLIAIIYFYI